MGLGFFKKKLVVSNFFTPPPNKNFLSALPTLKYRTYPPLLSTGTITISRVAEPEPMHFFVKSEPGAGARPTAMTLTPT